MAGYSLTTQLIGNTNLAKALQDTSNFAKQAIADAINQTANDLQHVARDGAPHKSGKLQASMHAHYATPNDLQARVGTNVVYAKAQEYGTIGMEIDVPGGRRINKRKPGLGRTRPYTFTGNIQPKFYMRKAMENIRPTYTNHLQQAARKIIAYASGK